MFFEPFLLSLSQNRRGRRPRRKPLPGQHQPLRAAGRRRRGPHQGPRRHPPPHRQGLQRRARLRQPHHHLPSPGPEPCCRLCASRRRDPVAPGEGRGRCQGR